MRFNIRAMILSILVNAAFIVLLVLQMGWKIHG